MIVPDANLLLYATEASSPFHERARRWWQQTLSGDELVGLPWASLLAFLRLSTNATVYARPLSVDAAVAVVETWLDAPNVSVIHPGPRHPHAIRAFTPEGAGGDAVNDVHIAALAWEHGGTVHSADSDFARIPQVRWVNPLT